MDPFANFPPINQHLASKAAAATPSLVETNESPLALVSVEPDSSALGWRTEPIPATVGTVSAPPLLTEGGSVILDFGGHRTGYLSFDLVPYKHGLEPHDAPCRLHIVFGEIVTDVAESFEPYNAWLSKAWLPDEIMTVDFLPHRVQVPRRHAFRFVKITVLAASTRYGVRVENAVARGISSAPASPPPSLSFQAAGSELSEDVKARLRKIDEVAARTLKNCMLTVYEDGPRRDRRLWIGDVRLQALTAYTLKWDTELAKRCLYLFAACPLTEEGLLSACVYETPCSGGQSIVDYAHLYAAALRDYVVASGDIETGKELFPVALKQFQIGLQRVDPATGLYAAAEKEGDAAAEGDSGGELWHFIDWAEGLHKTCAEQGVLIFGLRALIDLAQTLQMQQPTVATPWAAAEPLALADVVDRLVAGARTHLYDADRGVFISGPDRQVSWASNAWAVLAGVPTSKEQGARALRTAYDDKQAVKGTTPYLHHYLVEALITAGEDVRARDHVLRYWGSMVDAGAETFFEAWDPERPRFSPYGDLHSNSFCHAWSCTPSLLLRQLGYA